MNEYYFAVIAIIAIIVAVVTIFIAVLLHVKLRNLKKSYEQFKEKVEIDNYLYFSGH